MKKLLVCLILAGLAIGQAATNPILGKWDCTAVDERGTPTYWVLRIVEQGGKLDGKLERGEEAYGLVEPRFEDGILTFQLRLSEQELLSVTLTLNGNKLAGKFQGKLSGTGSFQAVRQR